MPVAHPVQSAISPEGRAREAQHIMRTGVLGRYYLSCLLVRFE
jgi:hypothetical protein